MKVVNYAIIWATALGSTMAVALATNDPISISWARVSFTPSTITTLNGFGWDFANNLFNAYYLIPAAIIVWGAMYLLNKAFWIFSFGGWWR